MELEDSIEPRELTLKVLYGFETLQKHLKEDAKMVVAFSSTRIKDSMVLIILQVKRHYLPGLALYHKPAPGKSEHNRSGICRYRYSAGDSAQRAEELISAAKRIGNSKISPALLFLCGKDSVTSTVLLSMSMVVCTFNRSVEKWLNGMTMENHVHRRPIT